MIPMNEETFSAVPVIEQHCEHAYERKRRGGKNNQRGRERAELNHEHDEHRCRAPGKAHRASRGMKFAGFRTGRRFRRLCRWAELISLHDFLHVANGAAEIAIFEPRGQRHHQALILALEGGSRRAPVPLARATKAEQSASWV